MADGPASSASAMITTTRVAGARGASLACDVMGPTCGFDVLLVHGTGQTRHSWRVTALALADAGFRVHTIDMRGHSDSDWAPDGDYSLDAFAEDVAVVARGIDRPVALVGASLGGVSCLVAAGELGVGAALVLVDILHRVETPGARRITRFMRSAPDGYATLDEAADAIAVFRRRPRRSPATQGLLRNLRRRPNGRWYWHWDPVMLDERERSLHDPEREPRVHAAARRLTIPTLLVRGSDSDVISRESADAFVRDIPHVRFLEVEGAEHMVVADDNDGFGRRLLPFLGEVAATDRHRSPSGGRPTRPGDRACP